MVPKATPVAAADGLDVLKNKADAVEAATKQIEGIATIVESKITELEAKKREVRQAVLIKEAELKIGVTSKQRLEVQEQGNIDTNALKVERSRFETAIKDRLEPVQLEELEDAVAKKHAHSLQDIARKLSLDEALLASLPKAVTTANPIRKVVNMLDALKSEVEGEAENEKDVHDNHMRHCENAGDTLAEGIADAEDDSPQLISAVEENMSKDLGDTTTAEKAAIAPHGELVTIKAKEVNALNELIKNDIDELDFISLALRSKMISFKQVLMPDDKRKVLEKGVTEMDTAIADSSEGISTTKNEVTTLEDGIEALDKQVVEATENHKQENAKFTELMASDAAEFEQMHAHRDTPPTTPEDIQAYSKKTEESNGVVAMMHSRFENLDEKEAQGGYEEMTKNNGPLRHGPWGGIRPVLEPGWTNISDAISTAVGIGAARSGYYVVTAECGFKSYKAACLLGWCESGCLDCTAPPQEPSWTKVADKNCRAACLLDWCESGCLDCTAPPQDRYFYRRGSLS